VRSPTNTGCRISPTVEKWDSGTYTVEGADSVPASERAMRAGLRRGSISFLLAGKKLKGVYSLVRLKNPKQWLLIKRHAKQ
jgi:bifunctional non-homologous end joining protein LigD